MKNSKDLIHMKESDIKIYVALNNKDLDIILDALDTGNADEYTRNLIQTLTVSKKHNTNEL